MTDPLSTDAFEDLAHALRILLETHIRANAGGLLQVDRNEAIGNIESALTGVLNGFHSLSDAMEKGPARGRINWYASPPLATLLTVRNARHHNHAKKIRSLYSWYAQDAARQGSLETVVLVDYPTVEADAQAFDLHLSWHDLKALFAMPRSETRIRPQVEASVRGYIGSDSFATYAAQFQLQESRVFFNIVPVIVNAALTIVPAIKDLIAARTMEAETYLHAFDGNASAADMTQPVVNCGPIAW
jgi:hypothetical protein